MGKEFLPQMNADAHRLGKRICAVLIAPFANAIAQSKSKRLPIFHLRPSAFICGLILRFLSVSIGAPSVANSSPRVILTSNALPSRQTHSRHDWHRAGRGEFVAVSSSAKEG